MMIKNILKKSLILSLMVSAVQVSFAQLDQKANLEEIGNGVWKMTVGKPDKINLRNLLDITPRWKAIEQLKSTPIPYDTDEIRVDLIDGKTYLRFPLDKGEKIFGLGMNFKTVQQRGRIMTLHVDHYPLTKNDDGRTHAPVPFFVSSKGYGVLINSARYMKVYVGTTTRWDSKNLPEAIDRTSKTSISGKRAVWEAVPYSDNLEVLVPTEGAEVLFFTGETMLDVVKRHNLYNGGGALPPKWGLGFWYRTPSGYNEAQVLTDIAQFKEKKFPLSVLGLEPGWQDFAYPCSYQWDKRRFASPTDFMAKMTDDNIKVNLWINAGVSPTSELFEPMKPYSASHTQWIGLVPDYTMPEAQKLATAHFKKHLFDIGVSGLKMDENDGYDHWIFPDVTIFPSGAPAEHLRQLYGSLMQKFTFDSFKAANKRTYGLVRSGNAGTTSFPYAIYNDYYAHADLITALINSSFIGVMWTPEARSSASYEDWLRRLQVVCFSPVAMLNSWQSRQKPWDFKEVEKEVQEVVELRMQLLPYLYTAFAEYAYKGTPPMRAMNLEPAFTAETTTEIKGKLHHTDNPYEMAITKEMKDQFMFGNDILVAPFFYHKFKPKTGDFREVILPTGKWYDFYTGEYVGSAETIKVMAQNPDGTFKRIPLYVRDGAIIPMIPVSTTIDDTKHPLEIRHYGEKSSTYDLYDDDGETFDFEKGEFSVTKISVKVAKNGKKTGTVKFPSNGKLWSYNKKYTFKYMTK